MVNLKDSTVFDYIRYVGSFALLIFSTVVTFYAILEQKTSFWKAVPGWASLIIFLVVLFLLGVMEGIQVSKYLLQHLFIAVHKVFVVCLVFFAAKLTTIHGNDGEFLFYVPEIVQTGLLACVIVVIVAQLTPQIVASIYPVEFMQTMVGLPAYYACIALETTGITHFTWVLADLSCRACGLELNNNQNSGDEKPRRAGEQNAAYTSEAV